MPEAALITLVGIPGCGKSHLCANVTGNLTYPEQKIIWICYDSLIPEEAFRLISPFSEHTNWSQWRQAILSCIGRILSLWKRLTLPPPVPNSYESVIWTRIEHQAETVLPDQDIIILLDDNFYYTSMRRSYFLLAKHHTVGFGSLVCHCPQDVCLTRNQIRSNHVSPHFITEMAEKIEWPDVNNSWEKHTWEFDTNCLLSGEIQFVELQKFFDKVKSNPTSTVEEEVFRNREVDRQITLNSILHLVDNYLRDLVRNLMLSSDSEWRSKYSKTVASLKADVLFAIRQSIRSTGFCTVSTDFYKKLAGEHFEYRLSQLTE